ncbi:Thiol-disulfide isomerase or thioredoxin [Arthrobacter subterraneus]|uniref:Thiol-disulfide isomerase or thioredoxin n=1 Tax=Arthrobacter subterraneus TaxID=335973 RepID=A0A1G8PZV7_9MICC|nr:TlpA disulfide reductase family protein [Arthrobacter subterraneus]SDI97963.1 Thiol-disulfide isomerase or thioredoxin [Arthrobacter subterraneus]
MNAYSAVASGRKVRRIGGCVVLVASLFLTGCVAADPLADQATAGSTNYVAGDGSIAEYAPESRGEPLTVQGTLFDGTRAGSQEWAGQVVVLNVWYAACAPCRAESPTLAALHEDFAQQGVQFYGINIRDESATADAFERNFDISYPSFEDRDGRILLSLTEYVPPQAVPTTLVLDREGRVAARVLGIADENVLRTLITEELGRAASVADETGTGTGTNAP